MRSWGRGSWVGTGGLPRLPHMVKTCEDYDYRYLFLFYIILYGSFITLWFFFIMTLNH